MTRDDINRFLARRQESWQRRDVDALARDHAEDCVLDSPMAGTITGRLAIEDFYMRLLSSFPDFALDETDFIIDGDRIAQISKASGTDQGGFMGRPPTGKRFTYPFVLIYRMHDGRIVHQQAIYDFTSLLMQIGVLKAKPL